MRWMTRGDVDGFFGLALDNLRSVEIVTDDDTFTVGSEAAVMLLTDASNRWVLFTVEGELLHHWEVVHLDGTVKLLTLPIGEEHVPNVWLGASFPAPADVEARKLLPPGRFMWGSDYPHDEGSGPFSREHLRQVMSDLDEAEKRAILGENAAALYGFDLEALAPLAEQYGPTVEELAEPLTELSPNPNAALLRGTPNSRVA